MASAGYAMHSDRYAPDNLRNIQNQVYGHANTMNPHQSAPDFNQIELAKHQDSELYWYKWDQYMDA